MPTVHGLSATTSATEWQEPSYTCPNGHVVTKTGGGQVLSIIWIGGWMRLTCAEGNRLGARVTALDRACIGNAKVETGADSSRNCGTSKRHHGKQGRYLEVHLKGR